MKLVPGTMVTLYHVSENSDKVEGRGYTLREWWFESKVDATGRAKGIGGMGSDAYISEQEFIVGADGKLYTGPRSPGPSLDRVFTVSDGNLARSASDKLSPDEVTALKKLGTFLLLS